MLSFLDKVRGVPVKNTFCLSFYLCVLAVGLAGSLSAGVITINGTSNIWGAGHATAPGANGGTVPPVITFAAGSVGYVVINSVTGTVDCDGTGTDCTPAPAEGNPNGSGPLTGSNFSATGGLSGIKYIGRTMFLIGVFLDGTDPTGGIAPATLDYSITSPSALIVSPLMKQLFFVGDGLGTGSATQHFMVPTGATQLFLGFADGSPLFGGATTPTTPNSYNDNTGSLTVDFTLVPEPGSALLAGLGITVLALLRRRRA
jgi:hypothetical protein